MEIKNLLTSGCSFSEDGIGGMPPTTDSPGGCSFIYDPDFDLMEPRSWPGRLARKLQVTSLVNVASGGHGNILISHSLISMLRQIKYKKEDTLVMFNLSDPTRHDFYTAEKSKSKSRSNSWNPDHSSLVPYNLQVDRLVIGCEYYTSQSVFLLMNYLRTNGFNFYFMMMSDYTDDESLGPIIEEFKDHLITFDPGPSMMQWAVKTNNVISNQDHHPSTTGQRLIADMIYNKIVHRT